MQPGLAIELYLHLRDVELKNINDDYKVSVANVERQMRELETKFVGAFGKQLATKKHPTTTISTTAGTCYRDIRTSVRVNDAEAFRKFVLEDPLERIMLMEARAAKLETLNYLIGKDQYVKPDKDKPLESYNPNPVPGIVIELSEHAKFSQPKKRG